MMMMMMTMMTALIQQLELSTGGLTVISLKLSDWSIHQRKENVWRKTAMMDVNEISCLE